MSNVLRAIPRTFDRNRSLLGVASLLIGLFAWWLAARTAKLGANHLDTVATKHNLASLYLAEEKYAPAEALYKEVLALRTAKLGADHPDTLTSKNELARLASEANTSGQAFPRSSSLPTLPPPACTRSRSTASSFGVSRTTCPPARSVPQASSTKI